MVEHLISMTYLVVSFLAFSGKSLNHLMHALNGNKKIGYNVASWNCRRGLIDPDGSPSSKLTDIQMYLQKHQLHVFGIIEADLHGPKSRIYRRNPLTTPRWIP